MKVNPANFPNKNICNLNNSIWMPHVVKNGGSTICDNLNFYCKDKEDKFDVSTSPDAAYQKYSKQRYGRPISGDWLRITNKETNKKFYGDIVNPIEKEMFDWCKILIVRDPIDRIISKFNYDRYQYIHQKIMDWELENFLDTSSFDEYIDRPWLVSSGNKNTITNDEIIKGVPFCGYRSHSVELTDRQKIAINPLIEDISNEIIDILFDVIIDIKHLDVIKKFLNDYFLCDQSFAWVDHNISDTHFERIKKLPTSVSQFNRSQFTNDHLKKLKKIPDFEYDLEFYKRFESN